MTILAIINTILIISILGILIYYIVSNRNKKCDIDTDEVLDNIVKNGNVIDRKKQLTSPVNSVAETPNTLSNNPLPVLPTKEEIKVEDKIVPNNMIPPPYYAEPIRNKSDDSGTIGSF